MEKVINLRYADKCRKCGVSISAGSQAYWHGKRFGISHYPRCTSEPDAKPTKPKTNERTFIIDWPKLREIYLGLIDGSKQPSDVVKRDHNAKHLAMHLKGWTTDWKWYGASGQEMKTWINSGFHVPGIENANPDLIPHRKRRRMRFGEEGELQVDLALSGYDYPFLEWEKRERKPGMRLEIAVSFSAITNASVIAQYQRWIAQAISTLEETGYDLEVNLSNEVDNSWMRSYGREKTMIRVKRENEAIDFAQWSALFSPGAFRHLMFLAKIIGADEAGQDADHGLGSPIGLDWKVTLDEITSTLSIRNPTAPSSFPEAAMSEEFIKLVHPSH
jgi:hypothetical protein